MGRAVSSSAANDVAVALSDCWPAAGACVSRDPEEFFDVPARGLGEPRAVCARCPVVALCLARMLHTNSGRKEFRHGVWGGINADRVSGTMVNYITAIARSAVDSPAGNEAAYIASRFLVERIDDDVRQGRRPIPESIYREFITELTAAGHRYLAEAVADVLEHPRGNFSHQHTQEFVLLVRHVRNTQGVPRFPRNEIGEPRRRALGQ